MRRLRAASAGIRTRLPRPEGRRVPTWVVPRDEGWAPRLSRIRRLFPKQRPVLRSQGTPGFAPNPAGDEQGRC